MVKIFRYLSFDNFDWKNETQSQRVRNLHFTLEPPIISGYAWVSHNSGMKKDREGYHAWFDWSINIGPLMFSFQVGAR